MNQQMKAAYRKGAIAVVSRHAGGETGNSGPCGAASPSIDDIIDGFVEAKGLVIRAGRRSEGEGGVHARTGNGNCAGTPVYRGKNNEITGVFGARTREENSLFSEAHRICNFQ